MIHNVITAAHFLIPQPETPSPITDPESLQIPVKNELMDNFFELWRTEYLRSLPMGAGRTEGVTASLAVGSVVLLHGEGSSRALCL